MQKTSRIQPAKRDGGNLMLATFLQKSLAIIAVIIGLYPFQTNAQAALDRPMSRPNVIIVLVDNHGYFELSRNGHQVVHTPRLDRLSREAAYFTDFNAPPFCSPSRAALLTGRYALRSGVHNTVGGVSILNKEEKTLVDFLHEAGYRTAVFGKWHLGQDYPYAPQYRGFDEVYVHGGGGVSQLPDYYGNSHMDATYKHNDLYVKSRGFSTDVLFDQAIDFIGRNREDPFFCFISTPAVHFPTLKHPEVAQRMLNRGVENSNDLAIWSMIENVDDNVGRLLDYTDSIAIRQNTLIIIASDQGVNDRGAIQHRAGEFVNRGVQYDEKHQVYCMIQYPALTDRYPGDVSELAGVVDITPTILDICGFAQPKYLDGQSLKPLLARNGQWNNERVLIVQCPRARDRAKWVNVSVKYKKWRLVDGNALYNVADDPGQLVNLLDKHPGIAEDLADAYDVFWNSLPSQGALLSRHILGAGEAGEIRLNAMDWYKGDHPWTQGALDYKTHQGTWAVEIARDGRYRLEMRRYPREASLAIGATGAEVQIGMARASKPIDKADKKAILEMDLDAGRYDMQTFFRDDTDSLASWGAYYVYVQYLD